mmetsp:Transcript_17742/g.31690  ORF Transcript_17742/g.31690 Transcript_17742/m.31690 type:complete len:207 (-) Transcript_17742:2626-3246(-)
MKMSNITTSPQLRGCQMLPWRESFPSSLSSSSSSSLSSSFTSKSSSSNSSTSSCSSKATACSSSSTLCPSSCTSFESAASSCFSSTASSVCSSASHLSAKGAACTASLAFCSAPGPSAAKCNGVDAAGRESDAGEGTLPISMIVCPGRMLFLSSSQVGSPWLVSSPPKGKRFPARMRVWRQPGMLVSSWTCSRKDSTVMKSSRFKS